MDAASVAAIVSAAWPVIAGLAVAVFMLIVWCVRLESANIYLRKEFDSTKADQKEKYESFSSKLDAMQVSMNAVLQNFGRVEGKIDALSK